MTICNMTIEAGARAGMVAPDETTFAYLKGRPHAPQGADWDAALAHWRTLRTEPDATFDREVVLDAAALTPFVTWGTNPGQGVPLSGRVPDPATMTDPNQRVGGRVGAGVHGPAGRDADARHRGGHGVPRLVHQRADRGPAGRRRGAARAGRSPTACGCSSCRARCG